MFGAGRLEAIKIGVYEYLLCNQDSNRMVFDEVLILMHNSTRIRVLEERKITLS
jgi:hypothetical protein